jgi:hypothetical protein
MLQNGVADWWGRVFNCREFVVKVAVYLPRRIGSRWQRPGVRLGHGDVAVAADVGGDRGGQFQNMLADRSSRADALVARAPEDAWKRRSYGDGAKGPRMFDWAVA